MSGRKKTCGKGCTPPYPVQITEGHTARRPAFYIRTADGLYICEIHIGRYDDTDQAKLAAVTVGNALNAHMLTVCPCLHPNPEEN